MVIYGISSLLILSYTRVKTHFPSQTKCLLMCKTGTQLLAKECSGEAVQQKSRDSDVLWGKVCWGGWIHHSPTVLLRCSFDDGHLSETFQVSRENMGTQWLPHCQEPWAVATSISQLNSTAPGLQFRQVMEIDQRSFLSHRATPQFSSIYRWYFHGIFHYKPSFLGYHQVTIKRESLKNHPSKTQ